MKKDLPMPIVITVIVVVLVLAAGIWFIIDQSKGKTAMPPASLAPMPSMAPGAPGAPGAPVPGPAAPTK